MILLRFQQMKNCPCVLFVEKHSDKTNKNNLHFYDWKKKFKKRKTVSELSNEIRLNHDKGLIVSYKVCFSWEVWSDKSKNRTL